MPRRGFETDQRAPKPPPQRSGCGTFLLIVVGVFVAIALVRGCAAANGAMLPFLYAI